MTEEFDIKSATCDNQVFLGGSRHMAERFPDFVEINNNTDYDFNIQHCDNVEKKLLQLGFEKMGDASLTYADNQAVLFFKKNNTSVITRKNLKLYVLAFENMPLRDYLYFHWKSSPFLLRPFKSLETKFYFDELFDEYESLQNHITERLQQTKKLLEAVE